MHFKSAAAGILATLSGALALSVSFDTCAGSIQSVDITPCSSEPCTLKFNETYNIDIAFTASQSSERPIFGLVSTYQGADETAYSGISFDACKYTSCPVQANQAATFDFSTLIYRHPNVDNFRFNVTDNYDGPSLFCVEVNVATEGTSDI